MAKYDIFIYGALALGAGYVILVKPEWIEGLFPTPVNPEPEPEPTNGNGGGEGEFGDVEEGNGNGDSDSGYDCAKACRNCWCKSYNEKCGSSGCSRCKGGNRVPEKCGLTSSKESSSKSSSSGGGSSSSSKSSGSGSFGIISGTSSGSTKSSCPCTSKCAGFTGATCTACCKVNANLAYAYNSYPYNMDRLTIA